MTGAICTPRDVKKLGTILSVWAHPDDESFSAAGIMAAACANGQKVICVTATRGEAGVQDESRWPASKLAEIRTHEMAAALKKLGVKHHCWLGYHDGHCHEVSDEEGMAKIKTIIETYQPQTILTFGPDGITGHADHQAVSRWATQAAGNDITVYHLVQEEDHYENYMKELDKKHNIFFNIDKPPVRVAEECDIALQLTPALRQKKCAALQAMPSQTENMFKNSPKGFVESALAEECFVRAK